MTGRNRLPRRPNGFRGFRDGPRHAMNRERGPLPLRPATLGEELDIQHRELQRIISENRLVIDENTLLQRNLAEAKNEIHRLGEFIPKLRDDREAQAMELIERGLKLEAELRTFEPLRAEVIQLRAEVQKLDSVRQELYTQVQSLKQDISRAQAENKQLIAMKADIDGMRKELVDARREFEYEKQANEKQLEQKQAMEKNLISMAREIERLRADQLNTDRRARDLGGGGYGMLNGSPERRYPGGAYGDGYGGAWGTYDKRGPPRR